MSSGCLSLIPSSSDAESEDEAQHPVDPRPAPPAHFSANRHRKRFASQVHSLSPEPPARRRRCNKPVSQSPTPLIAPPIPAVTVQPLLPAPTLPHRIVVRHDTHGPQWRCRHTCGSEEECKHEQGWKSGSILGHEQSFIKHPQCSAPACPAHSILRHRDRPDRRGEMGRKFNQERRGRKPTTLPLPSLSSNVLTPSTSTSQERHIILYITEPSFEYSSYKDARGDSGYHYTLFNHELFKNETMVTKLRKMLFKGREVKMDTKHQPNERRTICYMYNYVSHT